MPRLEVEEEATLTKGTSLFSEDAHSVNKAMEIVLTYEEATEEFGICTDSRSVLQACTAPENEK